MARKRNLVPVDSSVHDDDIDDEKKDEELVYVGAQILAGNLD